MIIHQPFGITNKRVFAQNKTAALQFSKPGVASGLVTNPTGGATQGPAPGMNARELQEHQNNQIMEAHARVREQQQQRRRPRRQQGSVRLSNTDSLGRAFQIRARLLAKLKEVAGSDMDQRARGATKMDIQLQLDRVERQIAAIRRRERAVDEERTIRRRDDTPERRRRRWRDMQEQRIHIRRDFLFHANKGGFDPNNPMFNKTGIQNMLSSVAFDIDGVLGTMDMTAPDAGLDADFNMEVVL